MTRLRIVVFSWFVAFGACCGVSAQNQPKIAEASDEPKAAMQAMRLPEDWQVRLFAAEPMTANIVAFDVDYRGRVFVAESYRQSVGVTDNRNHDETWVLADLASKTVQDRIDYHKRLLPDQGKAYTTEIDRIRRLVDTDGDGVADEATTFIEGFNRIEEGTAAGVLARGDHLYLTCIPKLWKLVDKDDDGKVDESIVMSDGYGVRVAFRGHDMHGLIIGPDGRLYFSIGDRGYNVTTAENKRLVDPASGAVFRCELDGSGLEVFARGMRNPQELAFNDVGDLFSGDNNSDSGDRARLIHILQGGDSGWRMYYQYLPDRGPFNREKIWEPFHPEQPAYLVPPIVNFADGPSGLAYYPGTGFGDRLKDTFLLADFRGTPGNSGIRSFRLEPDGAFYKLAADDQLIWSVLATDVMFGPDGAIWISDWVNGWNGEGKGRIYRVTDPNAKDQELVKEVQQILQGKWADYDEAKLVAWLAHPDRRVRLESQLQLAERNASGSLLAVATDALATRTARLHAIWGVDQIVRRQETPDVAVFTAVLTLLKDKDDYVAAAAAKFCGENLPSQEQKSKLVDRLREQLTSPSSRVQYFAAMALGEIKAADTINDVIRFLEANDNRDPALRHAGVMALVGSATPEQLTGFRNHPNESVRRALVVALRRMGSASVGEFLQDPSPLVVAEAARAIHDEPIGVALEVLASRLEQPIADQETQRRILNANYRLGTAQAAERLVHFAARAGADEAMRLEALAMLDAWGEPDPRDRVLNAYRPLTKRPMVEVQVALKTEMPQLLSASDAIKTQAVALAASLGLDDVVPVLLKRVESKDIPPASRASALQSLAKLDAAKATAAAKSSLASAHVPLRLAALRVLSRTQPAANIVVLEKATKSDVLLERQLAWDLLGQIKTEATAGILNAGVEDLLEGAVPADTQLNLVEAAKGQLSEAMAGRLTAFEKKQQEASPIGKWMFSLKGGDVEAGRKLFVGKTELSCVRCHKVNGTGGDVGPDLSVIGKTRDLPYLLASIALPDAAIAEGFETAVIADDIGVTHIGIVTKEDDEQVELIKADGTRVTLFKEEIVAREKGKSAMPADLLNYLSPRELRDLVAYLGSLTEAEGKGKPSDSEHR